MSAKTKSEALFESFLVQNGLHFEKIEEGGSPRPDYLVIVGELKLIFELKELSHDDNFGVVKDSSRPDIKSHSRTLGDHIRRKIEGSRRQIQFGANQGIPSILVVYNNLDPVFQAFGTEDADFVTAMYGEYTALLNRESGEAVDWFHGNKQLLQENRNTSFSALARLSDNDSHINLTLFENVFAKVKIPYDELPDCIDVRRVRIGG